MEKSPKTKDIKRILLVEDDPEVLEVCRAMLETSGFFVFPSLDGETALDVLKREKFDLVILDIILPTMDGFSVFKKLRSDPDTCNIPVLIVSGRTGMRDTFLSFGADGFLSKPVEKGVLVAEAKNLMRNKTLLLTDSHHIKEKVSRIFEAYDYDVVTVENEDEMLKTGKAAKYKCVVAHLACVESAPEKFKNVISNFLSYKDPVLVLYSDSSVKGLEQNNTVAIQDLITKWKRAGMDNFYDSRVNLQTMSAALKEWLP